MGGKYTAADGSIKFKTINVGALDDNYGTGNTEQKVNYSDRGNDIDVYAPADGTLAANKDYTSEGNRPDTYNGFGFTGTDCSFGGTSAACPVTCGFIATVLEHNRDWTWKEVLEWIESLETQSATDFYYGAESTTFDDINWTDYESLEITAPEGPRVIYQANINQRFLPGPRKVVKNNLRVTGGLNLRFNK
jgi:hypothetical protein